MWGLGQVNPTIANLIFISHVWVLKDLHNFSHGRNQHDVPRMVSFRIVHVYVDKKLAKYWGCKVRIWLALPFMFNHAPIFDQFNKFHLRFLKNIHFNKSHLIEKGGHDVLLVAWKKAIDDTHTSWNQKICNAFNVVKVVNLRLSHS
jgi:hypothetical protein